MKNKEKVIEVQNLTVKYAGAAVVDKVSFDVYKGDFIGLAGPNGAGKTTLIKAILGLTSYTDGKVKLLGHSLQQFHQNQKIGYMPQKQTGVNPLFPINVYEVVLLGKIAAKKTPRIPNAQDREEINKILKTLGIVHLKNKMLNQLSGGQQQKVLLARALVNSPEILFFDEPSTALDPASRQDFFELIKKINKQNQTTIIIITHDTGYIGSVANKLLYLDRKLVFYGDISKFCPDDHKKTYFEKQGTHVVWHQHS